MRKQGHGVVAVVLDKWHSRRAVEPILFLHALNRDCVYKIQTSRYLLG